ncbi:endolytic transglycosylase MltG [Candidatus Saccharibacteria bacterium]|nr:endolytic transglycosylase MltG [Candidatus Saccharibacteria bacterium]
MKIIGLDVGTKRIGVARADSSVKIAIPQVTIEVDGTEFEQIKRIARIQGASFFVIGLPRNLQGEETAQSRYSREFAKKLKKELKEAKVAFQDESLTSIEAENNLKNRKKPIKKGDIDTEAATLILQDFLENFKENDNFLEEESKIDNMESDKKKPKRKHATLTILIIFFIAGLFGVLIMFMYNGSLTAVAQSDCDNPSFVENEACKIQEIVIENGMSTSDIASALKEKELIQNPLTFQIYTKINDYSDKLQAGIYGFNKTMSVQKIISMMVNGEVIDDSVYITTLPGGTLADFKAILMKNGFSSTEIDEGFLAVQSHPVLATKPPEASLEGYIFGETIEFDKDATVEEITSAFLDELYDFVMKNNLEEKFAERGLSLHDGVILASIIQKESHAQDMKNVASVFYNRLNAGMNLGSDVTASYAVDLVDPGRDVYSDNASVLAIDSCYNTRVNAGLPCGPISNPGIDALLAVAEPTDTPYLYFLTGDDGLMYYGITESDHQSNISAHCQELCNIQL